MPAHPSLAGRAAAAVLLMIGFYGLALGIAGALVAVPVASLFIHDWVPASVQWKLFVFGGVGAFAILRGIIPRPDRFEPPGPALTEAEQPRLFETIRDVARSTQQAMPREVYLIPDVNAWVAQRGGVMGFGSHRVMALGLPLLQVLSVEELRAVLAHEFGHYHGGDTALGPWIYKTRAAIGRTLQSLSEHSSALMIPFQKYGEAFLRISHGISRRQEYAADALAASITGAPALANGLRRISGADAAFAPYWFAHVAPVISHGYRPPIAAGFAEFLADRDVAASVERAVEAEMANAVVGEIDTHPPLRDRLAALGVQISGTTRGQELPAITLLEKVDDVEARLTEFLRANNTPSAEPLREVSWDDVGAIVWPGIWRSRLAAIGTRLRGLTPAHYPAIAADVPDAAARNGFVAHGRISADQAISEFVHLLWTALANALAERGWVARVRPQGELVFSKDGDSFAPHAMLRQLMAGECSREEWVARWREVGLLEVDIGMPTEADGHPAPEVRASLEREPMGEVRA